MPEATPLELDIDEAFTEALSVVGTEEYREVVQMLRKLTAAARQRCLTAVKSEQTFVAKCRAIWECEVAIQEARTDFFNDLRAAFEREHLRAGLEPSAERRP